MFTGLLCKITVTVASENCNINLCMLAFSCACFFLIYEPETQLITFSLIKNYLENTMYVHQNAISSSLSL